MISDFYATLPRTLDALPQSIIEDYENLWYSVKDYYENDNQGFITLFDESLITLGHAEPQLRYVCRLIIGRPGVESFYQKANRTLLYENEFTSWFAVRLIEVLVEYAGSTRLRQLRKEIASEWETVGQFSQSTLFDPIVSRLLGFAFSVLAPLIAHGSQPKSVAPVLRDIKNTFAPSFTRPKPVTRPTTPPQALEAICHSPFSPKEVKELLNVLGVVDADTGLWHLGTLTGKAAKPLSAFPAAYKALTEAKLMDLMDAPVWRKLFQEEFKVTFSDRLANYAWGGKTSLEFERYYNEARRWISKREKGT